MNVKTDKVLCATDGSHSAELAVAYAVDVAAARGLPLTFAIVNTVSNEDIAKEPAYWDSTLTEAVDEQLHRPLAAARSTAESRGVGADYAVLHGRRIAGAIVDFATRNGYGHIVVGSEGRSGLNRVLLGSVAEEVVRKAKCPVTVVR